MYKGQYVAMVDIPVAFMSADIYKELITTLWGRLAKLMVITIPIIYNKHVKIEQVQQVLYVSLKRGIYRCLIMEILFYKKLVKGL